MKGVLYAVFLCYFCKIISTRGRMYARVLRLRVDNTDE